MHELNNHTPIKIKVLGPYTFSIGDTTGHSEYVRGGIAKQIKMPTTLRFESLEAQRLQPTFVVTDYAKFDYPDQLHLAFDVLHEFIALHKRAPRPWNNEDAHAFLHLANARKPQTPVNEKLLTTFAKVSDADCAFDLVCATMYF